MRDRAWSSVLTRDLAYQLVPETFGASALEGIAEGAGQLGTQRSPEASIDGVRATCAEHDGVLDGRPPSRTSTSAERPGCFVGTTGSHPRTAILVKSRE